jgi:hypothetical protein
MKQNFELAPYSGLDLRSSLDLATYRAIFNFIMWNRIRQGIVATRAYEAGIDTAFVLLRFTEQHLDELTPKEQNNNRVLLYGLILDCLDKLDRWEDYLDAWQQLRKNTSLETNAYAKEVVHNGPLAERSRPFILRETDNYVFFHFLRNHCRRKELIERKLDRKRAGKKIGNLLHASPTELSEADVAERMRKLKEWFARADETRAYWENYWRSRRDEQQPPSEDEAPTAASITVRMTGRRPSKE